MDNINKHNSINKKKKNKKPLKLTYYLVVPFYFNRNDFSFQKKGQWTILDLLILKTLSDKDYTLNELADYSKLNKKLLIQIIIPFLKLKWITIIKLNNEITIHCTNIGKINASKDELPTNNSHYKSPRDYLGNMFTGEYIGITINKDITYYSKIRINELSKGREAQFIYLEDYMDIPTTHKIIEYSRVEKCVTYPYEEYIKPEHTEIFFEKKMYLVFTVNISNKKGDLPIETYFYQNYAVPSQNLISKYFDNDNFIKNLTTQFKLIINNHTKNNKQKSVTNSKLTFDSYNLDNLLEFRIPKDAVNIIYGHDKHKEIFFDIINNARNYLIIQSTFIGQWLLAEIKDSLLNAAKRGVKITILLGKDDYDFKDLENKDTINFEKFKLFFKELNEESNGLIIFHSTQTGSHSKILLCEHKKYGHCALIGSCNWLYTNFNRFEASVLILAPEMVKEMIQITAILILGRYESVPSSLNIELKELSDSIKINRNYDSNESLVSVCIVYKNQHYQYIEKAKMATKRIYIISDKFNKTIHRSIWDVFKTIPNDKKFNFFSYYFSDNKKLELTHKVINEYGQKLKELNSNLKLLQDTSKRKNHSKILAWDTDNILITSLNWLSADASTCTDYFEKFHEIGIYINQENIVDTFIEQWEAYK